MFVVVVNLDGAFYWARKVSTANVALMNMVSSNINQWGILSTAMVCWH